MIRKIHFKLRAQDTQKKANVATKAMVVIQKACILSSHVTILVAIQRSSTLFRRFFWIGNRVDLNGSIKAFARRFAGIGITRCSFVSILSSSSLSLPSSSWTFQVLRLPLLAFSYDAQLSPQAVWCRVP